MKNLIDISHSLSLSRSTPSLIFFKTKGRCGRQTIYRETDLIGQVNGEKQGPFIGLSFVCEIWLVIVGVEIVIYNNP